MLSQKPLPVAIDPASLGPCRASIASPVLLRWIHPPGRNWNTSAPRATKNWVLTMSLMISSAITNDTLDLQRWMTWHRQCCRMGRTPRRVSRRPRTVPSPGRAVASTSAPPVAEERHPLRHRTRPALRWTRPTSCTSALSWRTDPTALKRRVPNSRAKFHHRQPFRLPNCPTYP